MDEDGKRAVYCIQCKSLRTREEMNSVFKTGYIRVDGVDKQLGVCKKCAAEQNERLC